MARFIGKGFERDGGYMKVVDLSGRQHTWNLKGYTVDPGDTRPRSQGHLACRALLKKLFPLDVVCEEVSTPDGLFIDFFLPNRKLAIEIQGVQHDQYVPFFHKTKPNFYKAQGRDQRKRQFCELNGFKLVELYPDEEESEWIKKIL